MGIFDKANALAHRMPEDQKPTGASRVPVMSKADEAREWQSEVLSELRLMRATSTGAAARGSGQILNDVLEVSTKTFDTTGVLVFDYHVAVGSIIVTNPAATSVTCQSGTQSGDAAPTQGKGVQIIPAVSWLAIPIAAPAFTLYGTDGATVSVQVFTNMTAFGITR